MPEHASRFFVHIKLMGWGSIATSLLGAYALPAGLSHLSAQVRETKPPAIAMPPHQVGKAIAGVFVFLRKLQGNKCNQKVSDSFGHGDNNNK